MSDLARYGPPLSLGPGLGVHPTRRQVVVGTRRAIMPDHASVAEALLHRARESPDAIAFYFIDPHERLATLTNAALLEHARAAAAAMAGRGLGPGARVLLSLDTGPELVVAFFGCALLGAVPILVEPPLTPSRAPSWRARTRAIFHRADLRALIVDPSTRDLAMTADDEGAARPLVTLTPADLAGSDSFDPSPTPRPDALAFIQYTSGTTLDPRGVTVSNRALLTHARCGGEVSGYREGELSLGWLPLHHDMGLVGVMLTPFLHGLPIALMSPLSFILRPQRWLWAMHTLRGGLSPAPNFAYQLCVRKLDDAALAGLDLGSWRIAYNGAEFIDARTISEFQRRFAPYGFRASSLYPVYGMAEMVAGATCPEAGREPRIDRVVRERLRRDHVAEPAAPDEPSQLAFVSVGRPFEGHALKVVDDAGATVPERVQGQILLRGPSLTKGYVADSEATAKVLRDGWLWTGDLGYLADGELFVTGRLKDLIIKGGRNLHPYTLEAAAGRVPGCRAGSVAAFGQHDPELGTEAIVLVAETTEVESSALSCLARAIERAVLSETGLRPDRVVLVGPRSLPKTSSGKLKRGVISSQVRSGQLRGLPSSK